MFSLKTHDVYQELQVSPVSKAYKWIARLYTRGGERKEAIFGTALSRESAIKEACAELHHQFDNKYPEKS
jgi:hypothetical protein